MELSPRNSTQSPLVESPTSKSSQRLINKIKNNFADYFDDKKSNSIAIKGITERIKKHKNKQQSIYEKYLWTRKFLIGLTTKNPTLLLKWFDNENNQR